MNANPFLGVFLHAIGGLAAGSFYIPYKRVRGWAWETYWLVGGVFSWIVAPWVVASLTCPAPWQVIRQAPVSSVAWAYFFGVLWGVGGLTFGLSMRYLGMSLGYAFALGFCAAFGTIIPPLFQGTFGELLSALSGWVTLAGVAVCLGGIAVCGRAGLAKERELSPEAKRASISEFNFLKGVWVAIFAGVMSACMAFAIAAGNPIATLAVQHGTPDLWKNTPVFVVILAGGFTTNAVWCLLLIVRNRRGTVSADRRMRSARRITFLCGIGGAYAFFFLIDTIPGREVPDCAIGGLLGGMLGTRVGDFINAFRGERPVSLLRREPALLNANFFYSMLAGITWYLQFMFYGMGTTRMGRYDFSSWTIHMAFIIVFSNLWALYFREWKGTSRAVHRMIFAGIAVLIASTIVVGIGNYLAAR